MAAGLLPLFVLSDRLTRWRRRRFTAAGGIALATLGFTAALSLGVPSRLDLLALAIGAVLAAALPPALWFARHARDLSVTRRLPRSVSAGVPFRYHLTVRNSGRQTLRGLTVRDEMADRPPDRDQMRRWREPNEARRNRVDRAIGWFRWQWLAARNRGLVCEPTILAVLPPGGADTISVRATPLRRGRIRFARVTVARPDPFGLIIGVVRRPLPETVLVRPRCHPMPPLILAGRHRYQPGGVPQARSVGQTDEFLYLREYRTGDSLHHVHWRSSARRGKLVVKEYQEEYHQRHALVFDTFPATQDDILFEAAVEVAASVTAVSRLGDALLDLMFLGTRAYVVTAGRGVGAVETLLDMLACVTPCRDRPFRDLAELVRGHATALTACVLVLLSWDAARQDLVRGLRAAGVPVRVLVVVPSGRGPPAPGVLADRPDCLHAIPADRVAEALTGLPPAGGTAPGPGAA